MVQLGGFEPPTSGSTIRRSNQLSYNCTRGRSATLEAFERVRNLVRTSFDCKFGRKTWRLAVRARVRADLSLWAADTQDRVLRALDRRVNERLTRHLTRP